MKYLILSLTLALVPLTMATGQKSADVFERHYPSLLADENLTQVVISAKMFSLFMNIELDDAEDQELVDMVSKLEGLKAITAPKTALGAVSARDLMKRPASDMEELMRIQDGGSNVIFYVHDDGDIIDELAMIAEEEEQVVILSLTGDIDLQRLTKLGQQMNIDGFEHLKDIKK